MGTTQAMGMAQAEADGSVSLEQAVRWHLRHNHFPPVPTEWVPLATEIVEGVRAEVHPDGYDWQSEVQNPVREGETVTRGEVFEALHLWAFV